MWYKITVTRRMPGGQWEDITDQIWRVPYIGPYSATTQPILYSPVGGEEIQIDLKNDGNDNVLLAYQFFDLLCRAFIGVCLPPNLVFADWAKVKADLLKFYEDVIEPLIEEWQIGLIEHFLIEICKRTVELAGSLNKMLLLDLGLEPSIADELLNVVSEVANAGVFLAEFAVNTIKWKDLVSNYFSSQYQEESVILTVERRLTSTNAPNMVLTEGLCTTQQETYYQGEKIEANFAIKNVGLLPMSLHAVTVGGRSEEGYVQDFSFKTDITIDPDEIYNYEGELSLLHDGQNCFFVALQLEDGEWITNVPTETGLVNTLYVNVELPQIVLDDTLCSPGELRIIDSQGRITGLINGEERNEIPHSFYFDDNIVIFAPDSLLNHTVVGTGEGTYGLEIADIENGQANVFVASNIPITGSAIHQYVVDWSVLSQGGEGVTVNVDLDGGGMFEHTFTSDGNLTQNEYMTVLSDVNCDGKVDITDTAIAAKSFGSRPGHPRWNPIADINLDGRVDILDIALIARNFGKHYP
jgi:hypothetical protein